MTVHIVQATRWKHGWELHVDGTGVTQCGLILGAEQTVRDYIETPTDRGITDDVVVIQPEVGVK